MIIKEERKLIVLNSFFTAREKIPDGGRCAIVSAGFESPRRHEHGHEPCGHSDYLVFTRPATFQIPPEIRAENSRSVKDQGQLEMCHGTNKFTVTTCFESLMRMLRKVQNERFTFQIDSETAVLHCTLERLNGDHFSVPI
jgi:hypothetical protein